MKTIRAEIVVEVPDKVAAKMMEDQKKSRFFFHKTVQLDEHYTYTIEHPMRWHYFINNFVEG